MQTQITQTDRPRKKIACGALLGCMIAFSALPASAIVLKDDVNTSASMALANNHAEYPAFGAVGQVAVTEGNSSFLGTGTLVAPNWVLTAAHNWLPEAVTGISFILGGTTHQSAAGAWFQHPLWQSGSGVGLAQPYDFGLFRLATPVEGVSHANLSSGNDTLGSEFFTVGYGLTGTGSTGAQPGTHGELLAAGNVFDRHLRYEDGGAFFFGDFDDGSVQTNVLAEPGLFDESGAEIENVPGAEVFGDFSRASPLHYEGTTAGGDSGAPAFVDFGEGLELVGISSWGINPSGQGELYSSHYGDMAAFADVGEASDWIRAVVPEPRAISFVVGAAAFAGVIVFKKLKSEKLGDERHT